MSHNLRHLRRHPKKNHGAFLQLFDKGMYGFAMISPVMTLPQVSDVWIHHHTQGVSFVTWSAYAVASVVWLVYGILHKDKLISTVNVLGIILNLSIVSGILLLH